MMQFRPPNPVSNDASSITRGLVLRIGVAISLLLLLIPATALIAFISLRSVGEKSYEAIKMNHQVEYLSNLRGETMAYYLMTSYEIPESQFETQLNDLFNRFQINLIELNLLDYPTGMLREQNKAVADQLRAAISEWQKGNVAGYETALKNARPLSQELLKEVESRLALNEEISSQATQQADQFRKDSGTRLLITMLTSLMLCIGAGAFIWMGVVLPLRGLNLRLNQLLWSQTEHLTDRLNQLQAQIDRQNEMLTTARHDLKAPLSNIKNLSELSQLLHPRLPAEIRQNLESIGSVSDNGLEMINRTLANREISLNLCEVNLGQMLDKILQLVDLRLYDLRVQVEQELAIVDPELMEHALLNLITNARKFSVSGIGVGTRRVRKAGTLGEYEIELWVWNDGAVISAGDRQEIFKPGKQLEAGRKVGGHGLGLSIVKSIAERHHGRVTVESHQKTGTTFRIIIPELPDNKLPPEASLPGKTGGEISHIESVLSNHPS
jgi:signal transduction histidine kinase